MGMTALKWKVKPDSTATEVVLEGDVTESSDFDLLRVTGARLIFDAAKIGHVNSEGLRRLVNYFRRVRANVTEAVELRRCSTAIVDQLNLVPELGALVAVRSIFVPLECPKCLSESQVLVDVAAKGRPIMVPHKCKSCGTEMDLSEPPDRYFAFLE
jgi:hypothetical protein